MKCLSVICHAANFPDGGIPTRLAEDRVADSLFAKSE
jgi:hypothetical protein